MERGESTGEEGARWGKQERRKEKTEPRIREGQQERKVREETGEAKESKERLGGATGGRRKDTEKRWARRPGAGGADKRNLLLLHSLTHWVTLGK